MSSSDKNKLNNIIIENGASYVRFGREWSNGNIVYFDIGSVTDFFRFRLHDGYGELYITHYYDNAWHDMWNISKTNK